MGNGTYRKADGPILNGQPKSCWRRISGWHGIDVQNIANRDEFYEWLDKVALPTIYGKSLPYRNLNGNESLPGAEGTVGTLGNLLGDPDCANCVRV